MTLTRGIIVDAADGRAYVVWGVSGTVAHLMPLTVAPAIRSIRIEAPDKAGALVALYVNTADRRHIPAAELSPIGRLLDATIADMVADVSEQRARAQRAADGFRRSVIVAARAAGLRRRATA